MSPAARVSTFSCPVTNEAIAGFGEQLERIMRLPDVPRTQERLVAGALLALGRLPADIEPRRGLDRLT